MLKMSSFLFFPFGLTIYLVEICILVLKLCDEQLAIPLIGHIESLNVSAAAAIMLFEVVRQRIGD